MLKRLVVLTSVAALALTLAPAAPAVNYQTTLGSRPADITFATGSPSAPDNAILVHLEGLINRAADNSEIDITVYRMTDEGRIEDALMAARKRGVRVHVVRDASDSANNGYGDWPVAPVTNRECHYGCLSSDIFTGGMHAKLALFSSTKRTATASLSKAVWVSSSNLDATSGTNTSNNAVTYYGDSEMYSRLGKVFNDMSFGPVVSNDYFRPELEEGAGHWIAEDTVTVAYISPELQTNLWYDRLAQVRAPNEGGGTCNVGVMQAKFDDDLLDTHGDGVATHTPARELADLKARGCAVYVLVDRDADGPHLGPRTQTILCSAGIPVRSHPAVHDKVALTSSGLWYGPAATNYPMVFTGSNNMHRNGVRNNDDVLLKIYGSQYVYDLYASHFLEAWNAIERQTVC